jgi:hypothetical protein
MHGFFTRTRYGRASAGGLRRDRKEARMVYENAAASASVDGQRALGRTFGHFHVEAVAEAAHAADE